MSELTELGSQVAATRSKQCTQRGGPVWHSEAFPRGTLERVLAALDQTHVTDLRSFASEKVHLIGFVTLWENGEAGRMVNPVLNEV